MSCFSFAKFPVSSAQLQLDNFPSSISSSIRPALYFTIAKLLLGKVFHYSPVVDSFRNDVCGGRLGSIIGDDGL